MDPRMEGIWKAREGSGTLGYFIDDRRSGSSGGGAFPPDVPSGGTRRDPGGVRGAVVLIRTESRQAEVLAHYQGIAAEYNRRANRTCERTYRRLVGRSLQGKRRLLELGGGSSDLLDSLESPTAVACDLSREMLLRRPPGGRTHRVVAVGERLPFGDARFDGVFSINVLEHVVDIEMVLAESARVLADGGSWLAVTPNGDWERLLDLAEAWSLKIPEGPHRFLATRELRERVGRYFDVVEHRTMLVVPAGPLALSTLIDTVSLCTAWGWGFFQYILARKKPGAPSPRSPGASASRTGTGPTRTRS
jgi:SAM-dependent methyltransferase